MTVSPAVIVDYQVSDTQLTLIRLEHLFMDDGHGGVEFRASDFEMPTGIRAYRPCILAERASQTGQTPAGRSWPVDKPASSGRRALLNKLRQFI